MSALIAQERYATVKGAVHTGSGTFMCSGCGSWGFSRQNLQQFEHHKAVFRCPDPACGTDDDDHHLDDCDWPHLLVLLIKKCGIWRRIRLDTEGRPPARSRLVAGLDDWTICRHCGADRPKDQAEAGRCPTCGCPKCGQEAQRDLDECRVCGPKERRP